MIGLILWIIIIFALAICSDSIFGIILAIAMLLILILGVISVWDNNRRMKKYEQRPPDWEAIEEWEKIYKRKHPVRERYEKEGLL